jgi:2-iminobutanoate/2-iminopropanoate deaminase
MTARGVLLATFATALLFVGGDMERKVVATPDAPQAIGPYSQAIVAGNLVFCSGQIPLDPATGKLVEGDIAVQTERALKNLEAVLKAAGSDLARVVRTTVYLKDLEDFQAMNQAYQRFFPSQPPARSTIQAARLPRDARVEIDVIAIR